MAVSMDWRDSAEMARLDAELSMMGEKGRQIIYIVTETREIVQRLVDCSSTLHGRLMHTIEAFAEHRDKPYEYMKRTGYIREFTGAYGAALKKPGDTDGAAKTRVFYITDFHVIESNHRAQYVKAFLDASWTENSMLFIVSPFLLIPEGFSDYVDVLYSRMICQEDIALWISQLLAKEDTNAARGEIATWARQLVGLSERQIGRVFHRLSNNPGAIRNNLGTRKMHELIKAERMQAMGKEPCIVLLDVGDEHTVGLDAYSTWLEERAEDFRNPEEARSRGTLAPKGALLMGVPGTGKTAMARETARRLGEEGAPLPLIRFEIDRLQSSHYGESEKNLDRLLQVIGAYSPVVMLIDEIEKTFHMDEHGEGLHEVKRKMLGTLLQWLQDRKDNVFTFITANDIRALPPELLRDGRLDGRFFSFMPNRDELTLILCEKLRQLPDGLLDHAFAKKVEQICGMTQRIERKQEAFGSVARWFDEIAEHAQKEMPKRRPFMTGANIVALLENTLRTLYRETKKAKPQYDEKTIHEALVKYASSDHFRPQGQTNLRQIAEMWLKAWQNQYESVSSGELLPMTTFENGRFHDQQNDVQGTPKGYDDYMRETIREAIEAICEEERQEKAMRKKIISQGN